MPFAVQTDKAALEAQLAGAQQEAATGQAEAKAAREEAVQLAQQLEAAEQSKVPPRILAGTALQRDSLDCADDNRRRVVRRNKHQRLQKNRWSFVSLVHFSR